MYNRKTAAKSGYIKPSDQMIKGNVFRQSNESQECSQIINNRDICDG